MSMLPLANSYGELQRLTNSGALDKRDLLERYDYLNKRNESNTLEYEWILMILEEKKGDPGW